MTNLLPPGTPPELEDLARNGRCPYTKYAGGTNPCAAPSKPGAPAGVCADHEAEVRAEIAKEAQYLTERLPHWEKEARQARGRKDRAVERLEKAKAALAWYEAQP